MRILLVEDDEILTDVLTQSLSRQRYVVDTVDDGKFGLEYAQSSDYDLILIDVGLPRLDGITLCEQLRKEGCSTPILLMTAKDASRDRIRGLDAGADDYLTKPLNLDEFHARVRALLRRGDVSPTTVLEIGRLRLNPVSCEVVYADTPLSLTPKEYSLLELLMRNPSRVFSRGAIIEHLWSFDDPPLEDSVKAHIKGLRRKLKKAGAIDWVENVYGLGYRFIPKFNDVVSPPSASSEVTESSTSVKAIPPKSQPQSTDSQSTEQQFNQAMDGLWSQYAGLMQQRMDVLHMVSGAIANHSLNEEVQKQGAYAAHKLAGVLGMFGSDEGTALACELETLLDREDLRQSETHLANIPVLVERLDEVLASKRSLLDPSSSPSVSESSTGEYTQDAQILIISDNQDTKCVADTTLVIELQKLASDMGMTCHQVTFEQAIAHIDRYPPNVIVVHLASSSDPTELNLLSTFAQRTPRIPVIALMSDGDLEGRVAIAQAGITQILPETATLDQIWSTVTQVLQQSHPETPTILVVDDDPIILTALRQLLTPWNMRVLTLDDPTRFWTVLNATAPDLLVLDIEMPNFNGIELCRAVRTDALWGSLPIVFLTAHRGADRVQQVFEAGGDDYISKPIIGPEVLTRIMNRLERNRMLRRLAQTDALTGLPNHPQSYQALTTALHYALEQPHSLALAVLRLTELRELNMQHGHSVGHRVLQRWGQILRSMSPRGAISGYWEQGEVVIGIPNATKADAQDILAEMLKTLRQQIFTTDQGDRFQVPFEVAIAQAPDDGTTVQALYQSASL